MVSDEEGLCSVGACVVRAGSAGAVGLSEAHAEEARRLLRVHQVRFLRLKTATRSPTAGSTHIPQVSSSLDWFLKGLTLVVSSDKGG